MTDLSFPVEHFRKRAKDLLGQVKAGAPDACQRARQVYADAGATPDADLAGNFSLMRAQHVVAVEHGFASWDALMRGSAVEARLAITMAKLTELNDFGIGLYCDDYRRPKAEQQAIYEKDRATLRRSVARVDATVRWLRENVQPIKTISQRRTSYGWKHVAETDIDYITNGVFIAAAIIAGYPYEIVPGSPNVPFGMSEKSLHDVNTRRHLPERALKRFPRTAVAILQRRGIATHATVHRTANDLVWSEDGEVRTLRIGHAQTAPFIACIFLDHYPMFVSRRVARALGVPDERRYVNTVRPTRNGAEVCLMLNEVDAALEWALGPDARPSATLPPPPFERATLSAEPATDPSSAIWSVRAWEARRPAAKPVAPVALTHQRAAADAVARTENADEEGALGAHAT